MGRKLQHVGVSRWLEMSKARDLGRRLEKYAVDHVNKAAYAKLRPKDGAKLTWADLLIASHFVYAWMPTMLWKNGCPFTQPTFVREKKRILNALDSILRDEKKLPSRNDIDTLRLVTNNSVVGASKLLHVYRPASFPIWDSKVARNFFRAKHAAVGHKTDWYISWIKAAREWTRDPCVRKRIACLRAEHKCLRRLQGLRIVELVVFCADSH